jgi:hypothetical protein
MRNSPQVGIIEADGFLRISSKGTYGTAADLNFTTELVYKKVTESGMRLLLLDFRESYFQVPRAEAFNLVRRYELSMPAFREVTAACVFNRSSKEFTDYWQQLGSQRGYSIHIFSTVSGAEHWLRERMKS